MKSKIGIGSGLIYMRVRGGQDLHGGRVDTYTFRPDPAIEPGVILGDEETLNRLSNSTVVTRQVKPQVGVGLAPGAILANPATVYELIEGIGADIVSIDC
jgi:hypothetical protein